VKTFQLSSIIDLFVIVGILISCTNTVAQDEQIPEIIIIDDDDKDVPYVPTPDKAVEAMLDLARVDSTDYVIDLGSGDGRIVIAAARRGATGHGIDIDKDLVATSRMNAEKAGVGDRVMFLQQDIFDSDISGASVVTMYLLPDVIRRLRPVFMHTLQPGTRIVSHSFDMDEWSADSTLTVLDSTGDRHIVHSWIIPAEVAGDWEWKIAEKAYHAEVQQHFQNISIDVTQDGSQNTAQNSVLRGDRVSFTTVNGDTTLVYSGRIIGNTIRGTVQFHAQKTNTLHSWHATRQ